jgi:hypothetical protein
MMALSFLLLLTAKAASGQLTTTPGRLTTLGKLTTPGQLTTLGKLGSPSKHTAYGLQTTPGGPTEPPATEDYVEFLDYIDMIVGDAFNKSYLANAQFRGHDTNTSDIPGILNSPFIPFRLKRMTKIHCKKRLRIFPPPAGSLTKLNSPGPGII